MRDHVVRRLRFTRLAAGSALATGALLAMLVGDARSQQVAAPTSPPEVPPPAPGTAMTKAYVQAIGRLAYVWGWPLVNTHNRRSVMEKFPEPGLNGGVLPVAPIGRLTMLSDYIKPEQSFVTCTNQDVVYGAGFFALDKEPVVFQVPDFGKRFWIYALYDARTDEFAEIGKQHDTKPGLYLLVGPGWSAATPPGITAVVRSPTELAFAAPRVFREDTPEDLEAIQPLINQILFYPLSEFDGKMKTTDWRKTPSFPAPPSTGGGEVKWVDPLTFFDRLPEVMRLVPPLPGEEALYKWIGSLLDAAGKDPEIRKTLQETAVAAEKDLIAPLFRWSNNGAPAGNGWNSPVNNAAWGTDYLNRAATAKSNIFQNRPDETKYFFTDNDSAGKPLHGQNLYTITFARGLLPPVKGFWSLTLYNEHHFFHPNPLKRYSLGTKTKTLKANPDASLTFYVGSRPPGKDMESNWLPAPNGPFSLYFRAYWPGPRIVEGEWKPPVVAAIKGAPAKAPAGAR